MFTARHVRELLDAKPFRPFRICLSDGTAHEVPHPEFAWVFGNRVFIGIPGSLPSPEDGAVKQLSVLHISRIEELNSPKAN